MAVSSVLAAVSSLWALNDSLALASAQSLAFLGFASYVVTTRCELRDVSRAVYVWALFLCTVGLVAFGANAGFSYRGGRLQGLLGNANGAGVTALILFGVSPLIGRRAAWLAMPVAVGTITLAQARASAAGILVIAAILTATWLRPKVGRSGVVIVLTFSFTLLVIQLSQTDWQQKDGLLRTNNSRADVWSGFIQMFTAHPWTGVGWANAGGAESFYLKSFAELGIIGIAVSLAVGIVLLRQLGHLGSVGYALAAGVLVNSIFEGWILVGGSVYAWAIWLLASSARPQTRSGPLTIEADEASPLGHGPQGRKIAMNATTPEESPGP
jgi:hypothetical protein